MPPVFDKNCKLKVIEYGDHSKSLPFDKQVFWASLSGFFKRLLRLSSKA